MKYLSENQRYLILYMPEQDKKQTEIAEITGVDKSRLAGNGEEIGMEGAENTDRI